MEVRKLSQKEHIRTRKLWEAVFPEDTPEFLDYYYTEKTKDNEIYVIEDAGKIVSMIQLNPYYMRVGNEVFLTHYIVAVATEEGYRHRGLMRKLMEAVLQVLKDKGEPFTFLMPANEVIYQPFGFEVICRQSEEKVFGKPCTDGRVEITKAGLTDCPEIAGLANEVLRRYDVATQRDAAYYERLLSELQSEGGDIFLTKRQGRIEGICSYSKKEMEIHEPLCLNERDLQYMVFYITGNETDYLMHRKPTMMAKILNPEFQIDWKKEKVFINEVV